MVIGLWWMPSCLMGLRQRKTSWRGRTRRSELRSRVVSRVGEEDHRVELARVQVRLEDVDRRSGKAWARARVWRERPSDQCHLGHHLGQEAEV